MTIRGIRIERVTKADQRAAQQACKANRFDIRTRWRVRALFARTPYWRWRPALGALDRGWSRIYR